MRNIIIGLSVIAISAVFIVVLQSSKEKDDSKIEAYPTLNANIQTSPEPINIIVESGKGKRATKPFVLQQGVAIFHIKHTGDSLFRLSLHDENGNITSPYLSTSGIGEFEGSEAVYVKETGTYVLYTEDSTIDLPVKEGSWDITIEQPRTSTAPGTIEFEGTSGQIITDAFSLTEGEKTFNISHEGSMEIELVRIDFEYYGFQNLVNNNSDFEGFKKTTVSEGVYIFAINASGEWRITID